MRGIIFVFSFLLISSAFSQDYGNYSSFLKIRLLDVRVKKTGPYFGIQRGRYTVPEVGIERQWKKIRLGTSITHAGHMGFNYNIKHNVLGYDLGYWLKPHRVGLTYGANLFYRTDFDQSKVGIAPVVGFKIWVLHLQTGYHFLQRPSDFETNTFFMAVRIGIINDRDVDFFTRKKKKD
ncbi:MAG: hypothetical protein JKY09_07185 [Crocinitomicaceae bacterium]|nr:hypothetical protein [Crocinitomicaceae bacterium]